jgi:DNA polymerase-3 subunit delta'
MATPAITADAQNALLKTFEEPRADAIFVLIVPSPATLLPTLRSRAEVLILDAVSLSSDGGSSVRIKQFLDASIERRFELLKTLYEHGEDEERDLRPIFTFLADLERQLGDDMARNADGLRALYRARMYLSDKGALLKPLLEQLALTIRLT